jgi:hypothetical protein
VGIIPPATVESQEPRPTASRLIGRPISGQLAGRAAFANAVSPFKLSVAPRTVFVAVPRRQAVKIRTLEYQMLMPEPMQPRMIRLLGEGRSISLRKLLEPVRGTAQMRSRLIPAGRGGGLHEERPQRGGRYGRKSSKAPGPAPCS